MFYLGKASSNPSNPTTSALSSSVSRRDTNRREPAAYELIQNRLQQGQRVLVQVTKDELGTKGARLTTNISLPSRYLVYLPLVNTWASLNVLMMTPNAIDLKPN